ncbi:bactericidal permeability-increasing protein-like [Rana temporaria]|uniref:bactericidal permeability-increasing protein-like n=1 Tax=Rana temporaria TaxID=8407 RepID=UPI001AAD2186|nr:bactericidal permeability-increasing protein-like [Rana temporaria]
MKLILIFGMAFILLEAKKTDPGVVGRLTLKGLEYGWKVGLEELQKQLPTIHIPDVEGSVKVTLIGHVNYYVTELKIENLDFSNSSLTYSPDTGVNVSIRQGQFQIVGQMRIHCSLFSGSSRMTLSVRGFSVAGSVGITCDDLGHGAVWDAGCHSDVDRVDLSFSGGHHKWILNMFKGAMKGPIRSAIRSQICPSFEKAVQQMEKTLSTLPVSIAVDSVSEVEVDLVGPPLITSERFDLLVKGDFVAQSQSLTPYQPEKLVLPDVDSRMLLVALSQFSANSAGFVHYKAGFLKYNVTDDMIPTMSPIRLNINGLGIFAPEMPSRYPDSPPLLLQVSARSAPTVTCLLDSLTVQASMDIEVFAMYSGQPSISLFQIQADSLTGVDIVLSEETVGATISVKNFSLSLVRSSVGTVKVDAIQKTLNVALKFLLPLLNGHIKNIIPLPMNMLRLQNPVVRVMQGYVLIMTDLEATLSSLDFSKLFGFEELQTSVAE